MRLFVVHIRSFPIGPLCSSDSCCEENPSANVLELARYELPFEYANHCAHRTAYDAGRRCRAVIDSAYADAPQFRLIEARVPGPFRIAHHPWHVQSPFALRPEVRAKSDCVKPLLASQPAGSIIAVERVFFRPSLSPSRLGHRDHLA